ncbi:signal recognition particle protein [Thermocrinis sp.]
MLELLTERFNKAFSKVEKGKKLTEKQINDFLREIRSALLESDADYEVVKTFLKRVREEALKEDLTKKTSPFEHLLLTVYEELVKILGESKSDLKKGTVLFVGLQGTGKTTTIGKLAKYLKEQGSKVAVSSTDIRRPAAMLQLQRLAEKIEVPYYQFEEGLSAVEIAKLASSKAKSEGVDYLLLDTAGRLHIDDELMEELKAIKDKVSPSEVLYVADAMQGQEALRVARVFHERVGLTGAILTKMDGDARGGVAFSLREALGIPIKFVGVGEKIEDIELFYPDRVAQRIMGLGDVQSLVEKAQKVIPEDEAQVIATKVMSGEFDFEDMLKQFEFIEQMGPFDKLLSMIPGLGAQLKNIKIDERMIKKKKAIIQSMTKDERRNPRIINMSRKTRIAKGSGTSISDVNKLLKEYEEMKKLMRKMKNMKGPLGIPRLPFKF